MPSDPQKLPQWEADLLAREEAVNHPRHYNSDPSGIECIDIAENWGFCLGSALKYLWRARLKGGTQDLRKACWYIEREIARLERPEGEPVR